MTEQAGAAEREVLDVAIIGAGPAGLTAALYAARAGLDCAMFEMLSPGGQCAQTEHLENYPGYTRSTSGFELSMDMYEQASSFGAGTISEEVTAVDFSAEPNKLTTPFGTYQGGPAGAAPGRGAARSRGVLLRHLRRQLLPRQGRGGHRRGQHRRGRRDLSGAHLPQGVPGAPSR